MNTTDVGNIGTAVGEVFAREVSTEWPGLSRGEFTVRNQMSYSAADAVAAAYGGDASLVPRFIGFVYGEEANPVDLPTGQDRDMSWNTLKERLAVFGGNVQIAEFSVPPSLSVVSASPDDPADRYSGNAVTFQACTRTGEAEYAFDTSGEFGYATKMQAESRLYQVLLLGLKPGQECREEKEYTILARASLARNNAYRKKPAEYELAVSWRVTFY